MDGDRSLKQSRTPKTVPLRRLLLLVGVVVAVVAACGFWLLRRDDDPRASVADVHLSTEREAPPPPAMTSITPPSTPRATAAPPAVAVAPPVHEDYDQRPGQPSHPITAERERMQKENRLVQALNDAMDRKDGARLRELVREHSQQFPEDTNRVREGYEIVADCLERPGPSATGAARRYFDTEPGSTLRRFVQRFCLEPQP